MDVLQNQSVERLRASVQRLADLQFAMELAVDVSPAERRVLSDQILTRIGQVGFLTRQRVAGKTIPEKLHLGHEVTPLQRAQFLKRIRKMQEILRGEGGDTYTMWEDRTRRNRFYELLTCRDVGVLEHLAAARGRLPRLAKRVEACRVPNGFAFRRVWWEADSEQVGRASFPDGVVVSAAL